VDRSCGARPPRWRRVSPGMQHHARPIKWRSHLAIMPFTAALLALVSCGHGYDGDNCSSPIAATYTEQCNQYRNR
jgi:hypothetical protein